MFILMCGVAGSGKSTKAKQLARWYNAVIVSTDDLREELFGDANCQDNGRKVFEEAFKRIEENLDKNVVIFDAMNLSVSDRKKVLKLVQKFNGFNICYVTNPPIEQIYEQNLSRSRHVLEEVIQRQLKKFVYPSKEEGWDLINEF